MSPEYGQDRRALPLIYWMPPASVRHIVDTRSPIFPSGLQVDTLVIHPEPDESSGYRYRVEAELPLLRMSARLVGIDRAVDENGYDRTVTATVDQVTLEPVRPYPGPRTRPEPVPLFVGNLSTVATTEPCDGPVGYASPLTLGEHSHTWVEAVLKHLGPCYRPPAGPWRAWCNTHHRSYPEHFTYCWAVREVLEVCDVAVTAREEAGDV